MVLGNFVFLDENSTVTTSNEWKLPYNSTEVMLQITSDATVDVTVQGMVDMVANEWANVAVLPVADLTTVETIEAAGMFRVPVNGIRSLRVVSGGTAGDVRVYGIAVN